MVQAPILIFPFPFDGVGYSTNIEFQTVQGSVTSDIQQVLVNGSAEGVTYTAGETNFSFNTQLRPDENVFNFVAVNSFGISSVPTTLVITFTTPDSLSLVLQQPTAIRAERFRDRVKISVKENTEPEVIGYNFYYSTVPAGGDEGYKKLNVEYIQIPDNFVEETTVLNQNVVEDGNNRVTTTTESITQIFRYAINFFVSEHPEDSVLPTASRYFVVTAIGYDELTKELVESPYSAEIASAIVKFDTSIRDLVPRKMSDILVTAIERIRSVNDQIDLQTGSEIRDTSLDPSAKEIERVYVLLDFMHRSQSFLTLIQIEDENEDGVEDTVSESEYKQVLKDALYADTDEEVQQLVDDAFTKLAGNTNTFRKEATESLVTLTFYTTSAPTQDLVINKGAVVSSVADLDSGEVAQQFETLSQVTLTKANAGAFYDTLNGWYAVTVPARALVAGDAGNVGAGKIKLVNSGVPSQFKVTNQTSATFGTDQEGNLSLARRAMLAYISVDTGTPGGYLSKALAVNNVLNAKIISAGHPYMMRDWDEVRLKHIFGKVDSYLLGEVIEQVTEVFPFRYKKIGGSPTSPAEHFTVLSPFVVQSINTDVDAQHPIFRVSSIRNVTRNAEYDLTDLIIDVDTLYIDSVVNAGIGMALTDVISVVYEYRSDLIYIPLTQPIKDVVSLTGDASGPLIENMNYTLYQLEDPLLLGRSNGASDYIHIKFADGKPSGDLVHIVDEDLVLVSTTSHALKNQGVDTSGIVIKSADSLTIYMLNIDYKVSEDGVNTFISRVSSGIIEDGELVKVSYTHGENLTLVYTANSVIRDVAEVYKTQKHLTADVVAKEVQQTHFDMMATIVLRRNADQSKVDARIKTLLSRYVENMQIGHSIYQSDVIGVIELVDGVSHVVMPLLSMHRTDGSLINREQIEAVWVDMGDYYTTETPVLKHKTLATGGLSTKHKGVFESMEKPLKNMDTEGEVASTAGSAYIHGDGCISVNPIDTPIEDNLYYVSYYVYGEDDVQDIEITDVEKVMIGNITLIYTFGGH